MRKGESLSFSTPLFSLLIFLLITKIQSRNLQKVCSSSCGDIKNISYPFYIKGDPATCGNRCFELSCDNNKAILELYSGKYYVKKISYHEKTITLIDINLADGSCNLPYKPLSVLNFSQDIFTPYTFDNLLLLVARFFNCSRRINNPDYARVPCLSRNQSHVYVALHGHYVSDIEVSCSSISWFLMQFPYHVTDETYTSYENILKFQQSGFHLKWSAGCEINCNADGDFWYSDSVQRRRYYCYDRSLKYSWTEYLLRMLSLCRDFFFYYIQTFLEPMAYGYDWFYDLTHIPLAVVLFMRFVLAPTVLLVYIIHKCGKTWKKADEVEKFLQSQESWMPKRYSYTEIIAMTNHFKDKLGQGGFGSVYKGQLHTSSLIAVKVLENSKFNAEEFINEVSTIGRIHHVNVVQLLGFCSEGSKRALVYEYMPNGSLDRHIFSKKGKGVSLSWEKLHEIALGIAHGIEYLHRGCDVCILHFDIKPNNILLDHHFTPKVADFGLAKFYPKENDFVSISHKGGTIGYIAPELISRNFGVVSCKSDIYSFGMLMLEMAGGRRNSNMRATRPSKEYFPSWAYDRINNGQNLELPYVTEIEDAIARKLCIIGLWCIQMKPVDRPSMTKVMEMLKGSIDDLQLPPMPFFSSSPPQHNSIREIESDSSTELLISESMEECLDNDSHA